MNVRAEADILKGLRHSYLPQVLDFLILNDDVYTIMDYIPGKSLQQYAKEGRKFTQKEVIRWAQQLTETAAYLHAQKPPIIHGDIKPDNIILTLNGDICLIDFNISSGYIDGGAHTVGHTDGYSPAEQYVLHGELSEHRDAAVRGSENHRQNSEQCQPGQSSIKSSVSSGSTLLRYAIITGQSDIYSIGATLYFLIAGEKPSKAGTQIQPLGIFHRSVSDSLIYIVEKAMQEEPSKRFSLANSM